MYYVKTRSGQLALNYNYNPNGDNATLRVISSNQCNLYGFFAENEAVEDAYIQMFDESNPANIQLGVTVPKAVFKIPQESSNGVTPSVIPLLHFNKGLIIAVTTERQNATSPSDKSYLHFWHWDIE